jgi:hypothetical protein
MLDNCHKEFMTQQVEVVGQNRSLLSTTSSWRDENKKVENGHHPGPQSNARNDVV